MRHPAWLLMSLMALCALSAAQSPSGVVINEFSYDDTGLDDREFIELYNAGPNTVNIGGWMILCADATFPLDNNPDYIIAVGTMLAPGAYFVIGSAIVPNVNQLWGAVLTDRLENDNEVIALMNTMMVLQDAVGYETNKIGLVAFPTQFVEGQGIFGNSQSIDGFNTSLSRWMDGLDTGSNGRDFGQRVATPGASNNAGNLLTYLENFDALTIAADVGGWNGSFQNPKVVDPTVADANNPNAVPASPQGGLALNFWDASGGGNTAFLGTTAGSNFLVECYYYIAPPGVCPDFQTESIGVRGTTDNFQNHPLPTPMNPPCANTTIIEANGQTGICWHFTSDVFNNRVAYLLDENDGGPDHKILGVVPIVAGVNDGWQRIRLQVVDDVVVGNIGGVYGVPSTGTRIQALINSPIQVGTVYMGFREFFVVNANSRPILIDDLTIAVPPTQPYTIFLNQPAGPGSIFAENRGVTPFIEVFNLFSVVLCPVPGTGPFFGLCAGDPLLELLPQVLQPLGTPFHFLPVGPTQSFGPFNGIISGLTIDCLSFELSFGMFGNISPIFRYTTL